MRHCHIPFLFGGAAGFWEKRGADPGQVLADIRERECTSPRVVKANSSSGDNLSESSNSPVPE